MRQVAVRRRFIAQHYLIGGDWGEECELHSHHYLLEVCLEGDELDRHGYLADIVDIEEGLEGLIRRYRDHTLNDLPEFEGLNPSLERFADCFADGLLPVLQAPNLRRMTVKLWENELAWASCRRDLSAPASSNGSAGTSA